MGNYLKLLIENILREEINITKVTDAIRKRKPVKIIYDSNGEKKGGGERIIHPVAYGISKSGNMVLRAFQPFGDTKTKIPHWKLFRIDKIKNWKTLWKNSSFNEPPSQFNAEGDFNQNGDNTMSQVYLIANFQNSNDFMSGKKGSGLMKYNKKREEKIKQTQPFYKIKKNIENSFNDEKVNDRIIKYSNKKNSAYVNNDDFIKDMSKVNSKQQMQPQTTGPIQKNDIKGQDTYLDDNNFELYNAPILKNDDEKNNEENKIEQQDERNTTI